MYAREGGHSENEAGYEDVDARTVEWLQAQLAKRANGSQGEPESAGILSSSAST